MIDRTDDPDRRFRSTAEWQRIAARMRAADPLCTFCGMLGIAKAGDVVDHMHPPRGDHDLQRNPANLQVLCTSHHALKTAWEQGDTAASLRLGTGSDGWPVEWPLPPRPSPRSLTLA
jgi:5-methylcytosine-specific restriction endonuclease McrA